MPLSRPQEMRTTHNWMFCPILLALGYVLPGFHEVTASKTFFTSFAKILKS